MLVHMDSGREADAPRLKKGQQAGYPLHTDIFFIILFWGGSSLFSLSVFRIKFDHQRDSLRVKVPCVRELEQTFYQVLVSRDFLLL